MAAGELFELNAIVADVLPGSMFRVVAEGGQQLLATLSSQARRQRLPSTQGDRVCVQVLPYDPSRGRVAGLDK